MSKHQIKPCKGCGADIVWMKTTAGKSMPVDAETVEVGDEVFDKGHNVSHFATCKKADQFRKNK